MANQLNKKHAHRFYYEAGQRQTFEIPPGNLFAGMKLDINLEVDITTGASNAPDFQVARAIQKLELVRGNETHWSLSGEALAAFFRYHRGAEAAGNAAIAGDEANNVVGRMFLLCGFVPEDAARPQDYALDSRGQDWELAITWRNLTAAGTLFGTIAGSIAAAQGENYIDVEFDQLNLRPGPSGQQDSLEAMRPFMRGLREDIHDITSTQGDYKVNLANLRTYRGVTLWTTHLANTLQKVGVNTVLTDRVVVEDTQGRGYHTQKARMIREETSLKMGIGSSLPAGIYRIPFTAFGNIVDEIATDNVVKLLLKQDVAKLTNATHLHVISETTDKQG